jgi:hypothetical protein
MANLSPIQFQATATASGSEFSAPAQEENSGVFLGELKDALGLQGAANASEKQAGEKDETNPQELNVELLGLQILPEAALLNMPVAANFASSDDATLLPVELDAIASATAADVRALLPGADGSLQDPSVAQAGPVLLQEAGAEDVLNITSASTLIATGTIQTDSVSVATRAVVSSAGAALQRSGDATLPMALNLKAPENQAGVSPTVPLSADKQPVVDDGPILKVPSQFLLQSEHRQDGADPVVSEASVSTQFQARSIDQTSTLDSKALTGAAALAVQDAATPLAAEKIANLTIIRPHAPEKSVSEVDAISSSLLATTDQKVAMTTVAVGSDASPKAGDDQPSSASQGLSAEAVDRTASVPEDALLASDKNELASLPSLNPASSMQVIRADPKDPPSPLAETTSSMALVSKQVAVTTEFVSDREFKPGVSDQSQAQTSFTSTLLGQFTTQHMQAPLHQIFEPTSVPAPLEPHQVQLDDGEVKVEIMRLVKQGGGQIVMELTPPDQSKFRIDLKIDAQGVASLVVEGASDSTRSRLERGAEGLQQQFADMGLALQLDMRQSHDPGAQREAMQQMQSSFNPSGDPTRATASSVAVPPRARSVGEGQVHIYA